MGSFAEFSNKCYDIVAQVPKGRVTTYRAVACHMRSKAYRLVGKAMNRNPYAPRVPCHRVVSANGSLGGFAHGAAQKKKMLLAEGVRVVGGKIQYFDDVFFDDFQ